MQCPLNVLRRYLALIDGMATLERISTVYRSNEPSTFCPIVIIGAGASGLAVGCRLKERYGFDQFRIFDRLPGIGGKSRRIPSKLGEKIAYTHQGVWCSNRYPGVVS